MPFIADWSNWKFSLHCKVGPLCRMSSCANFFLEFYWGKIQVHVASETYCIKLVNSDAMLNRFPFYFNCCILDYRRNTTLNYCFLFCGLCSSRGSSRSYKNNNTRNCINCSMNSFIGIVKQFYNSNGRTDNVIFPVEWVTKCLRQIIIKGVAFMSINISVFFWPYMTPGYQKLVNPNMSRN